jgi:hypothetical protein
VAVRRLANTVTFCDGHGVFFVAASGQFRDGRQQRSHVAGPNPTSRCVTYGHSGIGAYRRRSVWISWSDDKPGGRMQMERSGLSVVALSALRPHSVSGRIGSRAGPGLKGLRAVLVDCWVWLLADWCGAGHVLCQER